MFARDGDNLVLKTSLLSGQSPLNISWSLNGQPLAWSQRVMPYHKPGTIGVSLKNVCFHDEGLYSCSVSNSDGDTSFSATLVVDCKSRPVILVFLGGFSLIPYMICGGFF